MTWGTNNWKGTVYSCLNGGYAAGAKNSGGSSIGSGAAVCLGKDRHDFKILFVAYIVCVFVHVFHLGLKLTHSPSYLLKSKVLYRWQFASRLDPAAKHQLLPAAYQLLFLPLERFHARTMDCTHWKVTDPDCSAVISSHVPYSTTICEVHHPETDNPAMFPSVIPVRKTYLPTRLLLSTIRIPMPGLMLGILPSKDNETMLWRHWKDWELL